MTMNPDPRSAARSVLAAAAALACAAALAFLAAATLGNSPSSSPSRRQLWTMPDPKTVAIRGGGAAYGVPLPRRVESGWDKHGMDLYAQMVMYLTTIGTRQVEFPPQYNVGPMVVSHANPGFYDKLSSGKWESNTFDIFRKYIVPGETTVVDFGTWIGPTLLFHGQYSKRSFGIEADPVAFAHAEFNVELNRKLNPAWGGRVSVDSGCVARPEDVGSMTMKAGRRAGRSMSGIGNAVVSDGKMVEWQVQCQTLSDIFDNYWGIQRPYTDVFIKIDVESYECKLLPSFYDWLKGETYLPKMYISFHPQISPCSPEDYDGVLRFLGLYDTVLIAGEEEYSMESASVKDFAKRIEAKETVMVYQNHHAKKIVSA